MTDYHLGDRGPGTGGATDPRPINIPKREPPVAFRPGPLATDLDLRVTSQANRNDIARRDLDRYYRLMEREAEAIGLTRRELDAVRDALRGTVIDELTASVLTDEIADALMHDGLGAKWGIDDARLLGKLADLTSGQRLALVDLIERS